MVLTPDAETRSSRTEGAVGNLPADVTVFVGRRRELDDVRQLLTTSRLVTLTGVGGMGKTRLALRVAASVRRTFPDGTWLVEFEALRDPELLAQTVAASLGLQDRSARHLDDRLPEYLRDKRLLLILDNCEHLVDACAKLVDRLLRAAPGLTILATGREDLGIEGETIYPVLPLSVPEPDRPPLPLEALVQYEAVSLFAELATKVRPGFAVTADNRDAVVQVCQRLDGMPLAIELAAARLRYLSVRQIVQRLDHRYRLLTGGSRTALPRQQTLRALMDWSYELCTARERKAWARLSVFAAPFDLDAAQNVCTGNGIESDEVDDLVNGLVTKSVLLVDSEQAPARYRLLETLREYGREQLGHADDLEARRRHRDYYAALVSEAERRLFSADQTSWLARLRAEHANVRAALEFCATEPGEAEIGLVMATELWQYWVASGSVTEGQRWLERLRALSPEPSVQRAKGLLVAAWLAILQNDRATAHARLDESESLAGTFGDRRVLGYVALFSGIIAAFEGDLQHADSLYGQTIVHHQAVDEPIGIAMAFYRKALVAFLHGESTEVRALCDASCSLCDAHDETWWKAYALWVLGLQLWREGDVRRATSVESEAIQLFEEVKDRLGTAVTLEALAWMAVDTPAEVKRSVMLLGAADTLWQRLGGPLTEFGYLTDYHKACEETARRTYGGRSFRDVFQRGNQLDLDAAVNLALGGSDQHGQRVTARRTRKNEWSSLLTPRESEVAVLIADGLGNKDIARRLVVSQRTAETHVENILTKLGFTSRGQIAAWVAEHRPG